MVEQNKIFFPYFTTEFTLMKVKRPNTNHIRGDRTIFEKTKLNGKKTEFVDSSMPLSWCNNVNGFFGLLLARRGVENPRNLICKIGIDDGRGKLKINLSVIPRFKDESKSSKKFLEEFKVIIQ